MMLTRHGRGPADMLSLSGWANEWTGVEYAKQVVVSEVDLRNDCVEAAMEGARLLGRGHRC